MINMMVKVLKEIQFIDLLYKIIKFVTIIGFINH